MNKQRRLLVTTALFIATFMSAIEGTIVTTAMPTIIASLDGLEIMNWVFSIYLLMSAIMTPIYGKLADLRGRKRIFIMGISIFIIGSALCGAANSMGMLILARAFQGIGAGSILPLSLTIIADLYTAEERANIMGLNNAAWGIASIVAPLIGGVIVQHLSWHWIFLINVPIGLCVIAMMAYGFKEEKTSNLPQQKLDLKGALLLMLFLLSFLYAFQLFGEQGFSWTIGIFLLLSFAFLYFFIQVEKRAEDPIIAPQFFKSKTIVIINVVTFCVSGFLTGIEVYTPMWLQTLNGTSATLSGMALAPMSIFWMVGSFLVGKLLVKRPVGQILFIGSLILLVSSIIYSIYPLHTPYLFVCCTGILLGIGFGMSMTTSTVAVQETVENHLTGSVTSLNTLFRTLGQSVMVAVYGTILNMIMNQTMQSYPQVKHEDINAFMNVQSVAGVPDDLLAQLRHIMYQGLHHIYIASVFVMIVSVILLWWWQRKRKSKA